MVKNGTGISMSATVTLKVLFYARIVSINDQCHKLQTDPSSVVSKVLISMIIRTVE